MDGQRLHHRSVKYCENIIEEIKTWKTELLNYIVAFFGSYIRMIHTKTIFRWSLIFVHEISYCIIFSYYYLSQLTASLV